ncbi:hypothetical protein TNCV_5121481 [Trichonephila clavipes]|nr:hypothetical protein TNCV_5121481 [Trichonephila clavipes]
MHAAQQKKRWCTPDLDYSLNRGLLPGLKLTSLKSRWLDGYLWPDSCLPVMESIPNKWYCHQESRHRASTPAQDCNLALSPQRHRRITAPQLACNLAAVSGRRISRQTVYSHLAETLLYAWHPVYVFDVGTINSQHYRNEIMEAYLGAMCPDNIFRGDNARLHRTHIVD